MAGTPLDLYDACNELLAVSVAALGSLAPERRYVALSLPSLDCCDQLTVHPAQIDAQEWTPGLVPQADVGPGIGRITAGPGVILATLTITVAWEVSVPEHPEQVIPPETLDLEASKVISSGWALFNGIRSAARATILFPGDDRLEVAGLSPLPAQGAMAGWTLPVRVQINGYDVVWQR